MSIFDDCYADINGRKSIDYKLKSNTAYNFNSIKTIKKRSKPIVGGNLFLNKSNESLIEKEKIKRKLL